MTTSPNPLRALFKSSAPTPDNRSGNGSAKTSTSTRNSRPSPKLKVTKPTTGSDQNSKKRPTLFNLISTSDPTPSPSSSSSYFSMLFPSSSLFASVTEAESGAKTGVKSPKSKHSLFSRPKKQPAKVQIEKNTSWVSSPWTGWTGEAGDAGKQSALSLNLDGRSNSSINTESTTTTSSKPLHSWMMRPSKSSKSDTEATPAIEKSHVFRKKKKALAVNSQQQDAETIDSSGGSGQIMLHPYYNLSNPSVTSLSMHPSSPPKDQPWATSQQYQSNSLQEQAYFYHQQQQQQLQPHHSKRGVTLAVHDVFGIGKVIEMVLALFVAHDAFLFRRPIWMQCAVMAWEAIVVLLVIWVVLRVVGLAEIVVWGADDLIRGAVSTIKFFGSAVRMLVWR